MYIHCIYIPIDFSTISIIGLILPYSELSVIRQISDNTTAGLKQKRRIYGDSHKNAFLLI